MIHARRSEVLGILACGAGLFGCAHAQVKAADRGGETAPVTAGSGHEAPGAVPATQASQTETDLAALLAGDVLHFGFDETTLTEESRGRLRRLADFLGSHPGVRIRIDGNCDERGTEEYNLALGSRRAAAAKEYLANLGVEPTRVSIISYGKERPVAVGHDEQAWAQNRRDDIQPAQN